MKTGSQFLEDMSLTRKEVYLMGRKVDHAAENPVLAPSFRSLAATYDIGFDAEAHGLGLRRGPHGPINAFCSLHLGLEDLVSKVRLLRLLGQRTGTCFQSA
jgi:4-hydroxybutyryl-CoA dehydratase/vinylacetyl-CoA-Delta-isomerase